MRLTQQNSAVPGLRLCQYVPEWTNYAPRAARWNDVTFNNAIDMATGHYRSDNDVSETGADEDSNWADHFYLTEPYADKVKNSLDDWPFKATPGRLMVYHTHDTFLVGRAMQNYAGSDLFNKMRDEVYKPLGVSKGMLSTLRTDHTSHNTGRSAVVRRLRAVPTTATTPQSWRSCSTTTAAGSARRRFSISAS
jgi:CubicO group peptidase (beta-lactamase class C family)